MAGYAYARLQQGYHVIGRGRQHDYIHRIWVEGTGPVTLENGDDGPITEVETGNHELNILAQSGGFAVDVPADTYVTVIGDWVG
jgi:hypothetical protein